MEVLLNTPSFLPVNVFDANGNPVDGLTNLDFQYKRKRPADVQLTVRTLAIGDVRPQTRGYYLIDLPLAEVQQLGETLVTLTDTQVTPRFSAVSTSYRVVLSRTPAQDVSKLAQPINQLYGTIVDANGKPIAGATVTARILGAPNIEKGPGIGTGTIETVTDENGFFVLAVLQGVLLDILIPAIRYRRSGFTVPDESSTDLLAAA